MRYVLAVLSHGDPDPWVARTLASFARMVTPAPAFTVFHHDGPGEPTVALGSDNGFLTTGTKQRKGFCRSTAALWGKAVAMAAEVEADHVFWLEHDFTFQRRVQLAALGAILRDETIAQCSLMRQPVNAQEKRRGRVLSAADEGVTTELLIGRGVAGDPDAYEGGVWLRHRRYFTTNPSLMRAGFMAAHPFAGTGQSFYDIECEGKFGADLLAAGYEFAVIGDGEPWVRHIGERTGKGY